MIATRISAALRREVRERAAARCEYCLLAETDAFFPHEADHLTDIGRVTEKLLQLNLGSRIEVRERLVALKTSKPRKPKKNREDNL